jgi:hypothetical protein
MRIIESGTVNGNEATVCQCNCQGDPMAASTAYSAGLSEPGGGCGCYCGTGTSYGSEFAGFVRWPH